MSQRSVITEQMIDVAMAKIPEKHISLGHWEPGIDREHMRAALEAAAPAISEQTATAERQDCEALIREHVAIAESVTDLSQHQQLSAMIVKGMRLAADLLREPQPATTQPGDHG